MLFEREGTDRTLQVSIKLPCGDWPKVNGFENIMIHGPFGQNLLAERINQGTQFQLSFFQLLLQFDDSLFLVLVDHDSFFQFLLSGLELSPVPSLKKIVSISERWLDQLANGTVFEEDSIKQQKGFKNHG